MDAYPARTFTGLVSQVRFEPVTNQGVVNYIAIVDVGNGDLKLRPGMTANASVVTASRENVLRLPNAALRFRPPEGAAVAEPEKTARPADAEERPEGARREHSGTWQRGEGRGEGHGDWAGREHRESGGSSDAARKTVYVLDVQGGLRMQPVELGISDGTWTEVAGPGPKEGDLIVTGIQTATEKETASKSGSSSPFIPPHGPGGPR